MNYSFSGINIAKDIHTFQVDYVQNNADIIIPGLSEDFRNRLIDKISQQTNLSEVKSDGDLVFEAEISDYYIEPVALTAQQIAAKNKLVIKIKLSYSNAKKEEDNFNKLYSYFYEYEASLNKSEIEEEAHKEIFEKILTDIFSDTLAKW
jgi:hypothetical protein